MKLLISEINDSDFNNVANEWNQSEEINLYHWSLLKTKNELRDLVYNCKMGEIQLKITFVFDSYMD